MVASAEPAVSTASSSTALALASSVPATEHRVQSSNEAAQLRAERMLLHKALIGAAIGAVVCAAIWIGLVAIATVGAGPPLVPILAVAAACGVLAGAFLGGCAGALAGDGGLEQVEHERMHGTA